MPKNLQNFLFLINPWSFSEKIWNAGKILLVSLCQTYRVGLFIDLEDSNVDEVRNGATPSRQRFEFISGIKPKDIFKSITEEPGQQLASTWQKFKQNLTAKFPAQTGNINSLCFAYGID